MLVALLVAMATFTNQCGCSSFTLTITVGVGYG